MGRLGYGIVSYFQLIYTFLLIFAILLCMHLPLMYNYAGWKAYDDEKQVSMTTSWTIGNLGQSMPRCTTVKMAGANLPVGCRTGKITEFTHLGVLAYHSEADNNGLCSYGTASDNTGNSCESFSKHDSPLFEKLINDCTNQTDCLITDLHSYIDIGTQTFDPGCTVDEKDTLFV